MCCVCTIGQGGLGTVALACHRHVYTLVAMKMVENDNEHLHLVMTEVAVLKMIKNLHIICLSQILRTESYTFKGMEYAPGGNLRKQI